MGAIKRYWGRLLLDAKGIVTLFANVDYETAVLNHFANVFSLYVLNSGLLLNALGIFTSRVVKNDNSISTKLDVRVIVIITCRVKKLNLVRPIGIGSSFELEFVTNLIFERMIAGSK